MMVAEQLIDGRVIEACQQGDRAALGAIAVAVLLGVLYPMLGASMVIALIIDSLVPQRWHERFGL